MEIAYTPKAKADIAFWKSTGSRQVMDKISALVTSISKTPYDGIGKPEPLKYSLAGTWSRRINKEHRIIYEVLGDVILVHSLRGHYF